MLAVMLFVACLPQVSAAVINDPENVTYMHTEAIQAGKIRLISRSSMAMAEQVRLLLYVPQNDSRQESRVVRVMGPDKYRLDFDEYGNTLIVLEWANPPIDRFFDYLVETRTGIHARSSGVSRDFGMSDLIKPTPEIIETSYMVAGGEKSAENMLRLAAWVNEYVEYDTACETDAYSAAWTYSQGRGTCDEFSNLYLSMLSVLGYKSWYVAGYAYLGTKQPGASSFGAHAWTEAELDGKTYDIDPTWAESPVDATHLTMARLPDSNFTELIEAKSRDIKIEWEKEETILRVLDYEEGPRIVVDLEPVPGTVEPGKNVLILADMHADGCVLSRSNLASCLDAGTGRPLMAIDEPKKAVMFCGSKLYHWIADTPMISPGIIYTCPVSLGTGGGRTGDKVTIVRGRTGDVELGMSTERVLLPGQPFNVFVSAKNLGMADQSPRLFAILLDKVIEQQVSLAGKGSKTVRFEMVAPKSEGNYTITAFSSTGDMIKHSIHVVTNRQVRITEIALPGKVEIGSTGMINLTLNNSGDQISGVMKAELGGMPESRTVNVQANSTVTVSFPFSPQAEGMHDISFTLLDSDGNYQDAWVGQVEATRTLSLKEGIAKQLEDFFGWLVSAIMSAFGL